MDEALTNLIVSLERLRDLVEEMARNSSGELSDAKLRIRHETQRCAAVVLLTGFFEAFLKDAVRGYVDAIRIRRIPFSVLPDRIRQGHFEFGGLVLSEIARNARTQGASRFGSASVDDIVKRLYSCTGEAPEFTILWEAFADTRQNPKPNVVRDILQNLGISDVWPSISKGASAQGKAMPEGQMVAGLDNLILVRNECAHTGTAMLIPSISTLLDHITMIEAIATGTIFVMKAALDGLSLAPAPEIVSA